MRQLARVDGVIFDCVAGPDHFRALQAGNRCDHGNLHVDGHAGGHAIHVDLVGVEALRLEKNLVPQLVGEFDDLIFNGRAVTRTDSLNLAAVERRARNGLAENAVRLFVGVADVALDLRAVDAPGHKRKWRGLGIARLGLELRPVDGAAIQAGRSAGLEASPAQAQRAQLFAQQLRGRFAVASATVTRFAHVRQAIQKCPGGDDHGTAFERAAIAQRDAGGAARLDIQSGHFGLFDADIRFLLEDLAHASSIQLLVHLSARRPNGGSAAGVEQPELDAHRVGHFPHHPTQRVDFAHQVTLGNAADGGVAGHLRDQVQVHGDDGRLQTHSRGGAGGFTPGVTGADDNDVVAFAH